MIVVGSSKDEFRLWMLSAVIVLALHVAGAAMLTRWHEPLLGDEQSTAITVDLTPFSTPQSESQQDLAPGAEQQQLVPPQPEKREKPLVEQTEPPPPPAADSDVSLPPPEKPTPLQPKPMPQPAEPTQTAPQRRRTASAAETKAWYRSIVVQLERHKGYPEAARSRGQTGTTELAFTIDRAGRVIASRVVRSSGHRALDQEATATLRRAQNFPPPPADLPGATFDFSVPIRFNIR